ncbi:MAG: type III-A CRISPR-associated protein Csm2 [Pseudothermotoga sp.]
MADTSKITGLKKLSDWEMTDMMKYSENVAAQFTGGINPTQLRKFHGHITKIWSKYSMNKSSYLNNLDAFKREIRDEIFFVKAYLAYQAGREGKIRDLKDVLSAAIDKIQDQKDFETFKKFYDSILAYHKFYSSEPSKGGNRR